MKINKIKIVIATLVFILSGMWLINQVLAQGDVQVFQITQKKINRSQTFKAADNKLVIYVASKTFKEPAKIEVKKSDLIGSNFPAGYELGSDIYEIKTPGLTSDMIRKNITFQVPYEIDYVMLDYVPVIQNYQAANLNGYSAGFVDYNPLQVNDYNLMQNDDYNLITTIDYTQLEKDTYYDRAIWYFDLKAQVWKRLKSFNNFAKQVVTVPTKKTSLIFAILQRQTPMTEGKASWYKYKGCDCAASPDYPKGTKLKVTNIKNGKSVIVTINDWGPERDLFPDRVIDLDVTAFKQIANKRLGTCKVKVEEVK